MVSRKDTLIHKPGKVRLGEHYENDNKAMKPVRMLRLLSVCIQFHPNRDDLQQNGSSKRFALYLGSNERRCLGVMKRLEYAKAKRKKEKLTEERGSWSTMSMRRKWNVWRSVKQGTSDCNL
jgi:hypothetical protein